MRWLFFSFLFALVRAQEHPSISLTGGEVIVNTLQGRIRGLVVDITDDPRMGDTGWPTGEKAHAFFGIRYAQQAIRFEKPQTLLPWPKSLIKNATHPHTPCYPFHNIGIVGTQEMMPGIDFSEDCLFMNIFAPAKIEKDQLAPVFFYVHGGGFEYGSAGVYSPQELVNNLVSRGIVAVFIEYRLGLLGFGSNGRLDFGGNLGLWDQTEALRYVRSNIAAFGGDPKRITVCGNSAGGASTSALALSTRSRDFFDQSYQMSGSILAGWALSRDWVIEETRKVARRLGCGGNDTFYDTSRFKRCMQTKTIDEIQDATAADGYAREGLYSIRFQPRFDGDFFVQHPMILLKSAPPKPTITGFTELELLVYTLHGEWEAITNFTIPKEHWDSFDVNRMKTFVNQFVAQERYYGPHKKTKEIQNAIVDYFLSHESELFSVDSSDKYTILRKAIEIAGDVLMNYGVVAEARSKASLGADVYFYLMTHYSRNFRKEMPIRGSYHAVEQNYLFSLWFMPIVDEFPPTRYSPEDIAFVRHGLDTLAQFLKTGNPNTRNREKSFEWPRVSRDPTAPLSFLVLNATPVERRASDGGLWEDRMKFWTNLRYFALEHNDAPPMFDPMLANGWSPIPEFPGEQRNDRGGAPAAKSFRGDAKEL